MTDDDDGLTLAQRLDLRELRSLLDMLNDPFLKHHAWDASSLEHSIDRICGRLSKEAIPHVLHR